jgi:hypothetical protein
MPDSYTAHYNLTKPEVNASRDTWGGKDNGNLDAIDTILYNLEQGKFDKSGGTVTGPTAFTVMPTFGGNVLVTETAARGFVAEAITALLPNGTIILWSGSVASIPAGWRLCDGGAGTPDLRDRFVIGAASSYLPGASGGTSTHNHNAATGGHTLTIGEIPSHGHTVNDPTHGHSINDPGHTHGYNKPNASGFTYNSGSQDTPWRNSVSGDTTGSNTTGISINANGTGITINANGGGGAHNHSISDSNHTPPFYALCYIMRTGS